MPTGWLAATGGLATPVGTSSGTHENVYGSSLSPAGHETFGVPDEDGDRRRDGNRGGEAPCHDEPTSWEFEMRHLHASCLLAGWVPVQKSMEPERSPQTFPRFPVYSGLSWILRDAAGDVRSG